MYFFKLFIIAILLIISIHILLFRFFVWFWSHAITEIIGRVYVKLYNKYGLKFKLVESKNHED